MEFFCSVNKVRVLKEGYITQEENKKGYSGCSPIALITGTQNILIGTGLPSDQDLLKQGLNENGVLASDIKYVICPEARIETMGNISMFPLATIITGFNIMQGDKFILHDFLEDIPYEINDTIQVVPTPGHIKDGVSVIVGRTAEGTIAFTGGVFHSEEDMESPDLWVEQSTDVEQQTQSRIQILTYADYILPRHGPMFKVPDELKRSGVSIVATP